MRTILLIFTLLFSAQLFADNTKKETYAKEQQQMQEIQYQCSNSQKSSANCHQDMMKACDLKKDQCLEMMERLNIKRTIKE